MNELSTVGGTDTINISEEIDRLRAKSATLTQSIFAKLTRKPTRQATIGDPFLLNVARADRPVPLISDAPNRSSVTSVVGEVDAVVHGFATVLAGFCSVPSCLLCAHEGGESDERDEQE